MRGGLIVEVVLMRLWTRASCLGSRMAPGRHMIVAVTRVSRGDADFIAWRAGF